MQIIHFICVFKCFSVLLQLEKRFNCTSVADYLSNARVEGLVPEDSANNVYLQCIARSPQTKMSTKCINVKSNEMVFVLMFRSS